MKRQAVGRLLYLIGIITLAAALAGCRPVWIPSESMKETLLIGDYLILNTAIYKVTQPKRGDVVVFRHLELGHHYVKRLIGLPGDQVQMRDGVIWLNGVAVPQRSDGAFFEIYEPQGPYGNVPNCQNKPEAFGDICLRSRFIETLPNGTRYAVLNSTYRGHGDNTRLFKVPEGHYFMMGDNRDNSYDSRFQGMGMIPKGAIVGRAEFVVFSSAGKSLLYFWTWRSDRFFKKVL